jgi:hypothetical protein
MKVEKFKSVRMSLMEAKSDINESTNKAEYLVKGSAKFDITPEFYEALEQEEEKDLTKGLITAMYEELLQKIEDVDTVGLWIEYDGKIFENAIKIDTLGDMKKFGTEDVEPIYEFFKLTMGLPTE